MTNEGILSIFNKKIEPSDTILGYSTWLSRSTQSSQPNGSSQAAVLRFGFSPAVGLK